MDPLGINTGLLLTQLVVVMLMIGLLVICAVPLVGSLAYWIIKPTPQPK